MNELHTIAVDNAWVFGAIAVSFFAGCVYRLCIILSREGRAGADHNSEIDDLNHRYDQEMRHIRQLQNELIQVRQAVEQRTAPGPAKAPPRPADLGIDPFKLAISGASIEVLMNRCRLSRAEAELVYSVHGAGAGRKPSPIHRNPVRATRQALVA